MRHLWNFLSLLTNVSTNAPSICKKSEQKDKDKPWYEDITGTAYILYQTESTKITEHREGQHTVPLRNGALKNIKLVLQLWVSKSILIPQFHHWKTQANEYLFLRIHNNP